MYLERRRAETDSYEAQIEFAAVLLYREREYHSMYSSRWMMGARPAPSAESPFQPFDLTVPAAAAIAALLDGNAAATSVEVHDLFGLKEEALDGLRRTIRPIRGHAFGWVILARLLIDLGRLRDAIEGAQQAVRSGAILPGLALTYHAALLGSWSGAVADGERLASSAEKDARRIRGPHARRPNWADRVREAIEERIRQRAIRTRTRIEGDAFARFWTTELAFCRAERAAVMAGFDPGRVPSELRDLVPLARQLGVGDDPCRALFIRELPVRERREAARRIRERAESIDRWLQRLGGPPFGGEAAAFFWLLNAVDDMSPR
jgi:hypothetical protein